MDFLASGLLRSPSDDRGWIVDNLALYANYRESIHAINILPQSLLD